MEAQAHRRDDAEGALAAGEQGGEVVAGVVLGKAGEVLDDAAIRQDGLDADHLCARHAMGDDADAPGVGSHRAADGRGVARGEIDAVLPAVRGDVAMQVTKRDTGAHGDLTAHLVDGIQPCEASSGQDDGQRIALRVGHPARDKTGVASLRDDGYPVARARGHHRRHFGSGPGAHDREDRTSPAPSPVGGEGLGEGRIGDAVVRADDVSQALEEVAHEAILQEGRPEGILGVSPDLTRPMRKSGHSGCIGGSPL